MSFPIPAIETQSKDAIRLFQEEKLRELLQYLKEKSPYYQSISRKQHRYHTNTASGRPSEIANNLQG